MINYKTKQTHEAKQIVLALTRWWENLGGDFVQDNNRKQIYRFSAGGKRFARSKLVALGSRQARRGGEAEGTSRDDGACAAEDRVDVDAPRDDEDMTARDDRNENACAPSKRRRASAREWVSNGSDSNSTYEEDYPDTVLEANMDEPNDFTQLEDERLHAVAQSLRSTEQDIDDTRADTSLKVRGILDDDLSLPEVCAFYYEKYLKGIARDDFDEMLKMQYAVAGGDGHTNLPRTLFKLKKVIGMVNAWDCSIHVCPNYCRCFKNNDGKVKPVPLKEWEGLTDLVCGVRYKNKAGVTVLCRETRFKEMGGRNLIPTEHFFYFTVIDHVKRKFACDMEYCEARVSDAARDPANCNTWAGTVVQVRTCARQMVFDCTT